MSTLISRMALLHAVLWLFLAVGTSPAYAGAVSPTCPDLMNFDATFMGANAACTESMFMLTATLDTFNDCLAPAGQIIVEAEDGAILGGPKIAVFISGCSATPGQVLSNVAVVPFFSSGLVKFTYRVVGSAAANCGNVPGTVMVALPNIAMIKTSPALNLFTGVFNGADVDLTWTLPAFVGDGYNTISVQRRALPAGAFTCLAIIPGDDLMYTDTAPPASPGGFEYRLRGILSPGSVIGNCAQFDAADAIVPFCGSLESLITVLAAPSAFLDIEDLVQATPNTPGVQVSVFLTSANHVGVTSVGIAVAHDNAIITPCAVTLGVDAPLGASLQTIAIGTLGVTAGFVVDFGPPIVAIPAGGPLEIFKLCYNTLATANVTTPLTFSTALAPGTTEVFAIPNVAANNISQAIVAPELTLSAGSIQILNADFVRGDFDEDQNITVTDAVLILAALFGAPAPPILCQDLVDVNDDSATDIGDPILIFNYLFTLGTPPSLPFGFPLNTNCGPDVVTAGDLLDCLTPPAYCP